MIRDLYHPSLKDVLHLDSATTSRDEGAHGMIKRDLEVSTNDFLTGLRSMERTLTHQHRMRLSRRNSCWSLSLSCLYLVFHPRVLHNVLRNHHHGRLSLGQGVEKPGQRLHGPHELPESHPTGYFLQICSSDIPQRAIDKLVAGRSPDENLQNRRLHTPAPGTVSLRQGSTNFR
jgi:hypothetical protein